MCVRHEKLPLDFLPAFLDVEVLGKSGWPTLLILLSLSPKPFQNLRSLLLNDSSTGPTLGHHPHSYTHGTILNSSGPLILKVLIFKELMVALGNSAYHVLTARLMAHGSY